MPNSFAAYKKSFLKNIYVIAGVAFLASAWLIEKSTVEARQKDISSKRLLWEQYRADNNIHALIASKFETMRFIELAISDKIKDTSEANKIMTQLRFALYDELRLRIETDEATYLLEKDPLDIDTIKMLNDKRIEATNVFNLGDFIKLVSIHERDQDYSFNNISQRTAQFVRDYNDLIKSGEHAENLYLLMYVMGTILVVFQKIHDTVQHEKERLKHLKEKP